MLRVNQNQRSVVSHFQFLMSPPVMLWSAAMAFALMLLPMAIARSQPTAMDNASAMLRDPSPAVREQGVTQLSSLGTAEATTQLINYYRRQPSSDGALAAANALARIGSAQAYAALIDGLRRGQPASQRDAALAALRDAKGNVAPALTNALMDADPSVRQSAAQVLGQRQARETADALLAATYDPDPGVRASAVRSLGELSALQALSRMEQLQIVETNPQVREAAASAQNTVRLRAAAAMHVPLTELRDLTVAPSTGQAYAVTPDTLYAFTDGAWQAVGRLPDEPLVLAAGGPDGRTVYVYVGTSTLGLYRSTDGGQTWDSLRAGLPVRPRLSITALALDPVDARNLYVALASSDGPADARQAPLGIYRSADAGQTWAPLAAAPHDAVTTRLVLDATAPGYLFGQTEDGAWRVTLTR